MTYTDSDAGSLIEPYSRWYSNDCNGGGVERAQFQ